MPPPERSRILHGPVESGASLALLRIVETSGAHNAYAGRMQRRRIMKFVKWGDSADLRGDRALVILAGGAAAATVVSIAAFEILMAATLLLLIILRRPLRLPPVWLPLALFLLGTVLSLALSGHAREGLPQIKKFYLYLMLLLVTTAFQRVSQLRGVALAWAAGASMSSLWAIRQFATKYRAAVQAHQDFYPSYVGQRITGFMDHWMTLSGQLMIVVLVIGALLLTAQRH